MSASDVLETIVRDIDAADLGAYGVHVRVGDDEAQHRWRSDDRVNIYSASKGVCALAVGMAVDAGILSLETTVGELLPAFELGENVDRVTVRHLLTMTSGIDFEWFGDQPVPWPDLAQEMLRRPSSGAGTTFQYSDASTYTAMRLLGVLVGDVRDWLMPRLFDPLGIHNPQWHRCPQGWIVGGSGLELRTEELARIGRVLRDRGRWGVTQLVSAEWVDRMHDDWVATPYGGSSSHYALAVWQGPAACWRLDGKYGQYVVIDDAATSVVTITAHEESRDHLLASIAAAAITG